MRRLYWAKLFVLVGLLVCSFFIGVLWMSAIFGAWLVFIGIAVGVIQWRQRKDAAAGWPEATEEQQESGRRFGQRLGLILGVFVTAAVLATMLYFVRGSH